MPKRRQTACDGEFAAVVSAMTDSTPESKASFMLRTLGERPSRFAERRPVTNCDKAVIHPR